MATAGAPVDDHRRAGAVLDVAAADVPAVTRLLVDPAEAQRAGLVVEGREPLLQLPLHRLGVGLVRGEHGLVGDARRGASPHRFEAGLREPQTGALGRHVRVGHAGNATHGARSRLVNFRAPSTPGCCARGHPGDLAVECHDRSYGQ